MVGVKPRTEEFNPKATKRSPSEFVLSRNLRRRHLSVGQKAAIALEWSEQIQLSPRAEKNRRRGRPKGALTEAAKNIGINEQRVFEVRQIRDADPALYRKVKAGSHSLRGALAKISSSIETRSYKSDLDNSEWISPERDLSSGNARAKGFDQGRLIAQPVGSNVGPPPSRRAIEKALVRSKEILGSWPHRPRHDLAKG